MRRRVTGILLAGILCVTAVSPAVWAAEEQAAQTEENTQAQENIQVALDAGELTLKNETEVKFTGEYKKSEKPDAENKKTDQSGETDAENKKTDQNETEDRWDLILTEEGGSVHTFENVKPSDWTEPVLSEEYGFLYINYKNAAGQEEEAAETAEEKTFEKELTVYTTTRVNVREEASKESKSLEVSKLGTEWKAAAGAPGWIKVEREDVKGYIFHTYVTEDKAYVDKLLEEQAAAEAAAAQAAAEAAAAQAAAEAAAAQAAAEAAAAQAAAEAAQAAEAPHEVSRQAYDDCDGSGHGYYEITYSDGSVAYEEY